MNDRTARLKAKAIVATLGYNQELYQNTGNPRYVWEAWRLARTMKVAVPDWVLQFVDRLAASEITERTRATDTADRYEAALTEMEVAVTRHRGRLKIRRVGKHYGVDVTVSRRDAPNLTAIAHNEYLKVRAQLPTAFQDVLDFAYYSGWRRKEITQLTWDEVDLRGGVIRLSPVRSKTRTGRVLPISPPLQRVLERRHRLRQQGQTLVFRRDGVTVRAWRHALRDACRRAKVPHRLLHDCRRTAARNLVRAGVPERVAMLLTGHKTRAVFDRYNIVNERELLEAGERLATYLGRARQQRAGRWATPTKRSA